jgi:hypothetical protein
MLSACKILDHFLESIQRLWKWQLYCGIQKYITFQEVFIALANMKNKNDEHLQHSKCVHSSLTGALKLNLT